ncbi:MAG: sel1 repeat family protein [Alphaproteobacteria bacterium]|nr:sel1 repeat family protein [Alphaproteobacteria bacterium]
MERIGALAIARGTLMGALAAAVALCLGAPAEAGYKEGREAYEKQDFATAWKELDPLAKQGNADAMYLVGSMYHMGMGVSPSYKDAAEWYRKSADAGKIDAVFTMGIVNEGGVGVPRNLTEAFNWYKKSADRGFYPGQVKVANMYAKGQGVKKDIPQSYLWFSIAEKTAPRNSSDRFEIPIVKDKLSAMMTKEQIADMDRRAKAWKATGAK